MLDIQKNNLLWLWQELRWRKREDWNTRLNFISASNAGMSGFQVRKPKECPNCKIENGVRKRVIPMTKTIPYKEVNRNWKQAWNRSKAIDCWRPCVIGELFPSDEKKVRTRKVRDQWLDRRKRVKTYGKISRIFEVCLTEAEMKNPDRHSVGYWLEVWKEKRWLRQLLSDPEVAQLRSEVDQSIVTDFWNPRCIFSGLSAIENKLSAVLEFIKHRENPPILHQTFPWNKWQNNWKRLRKESLLLGNGWTNIIA